MDIANASPEPVPFPESIGPLFCFGEYRDAERIKQGQEDPAELAPENRYGLTGGRRLVRLGTPNDGTTPEIAYDGFIWCGLGEVTTGTKITSLEVPGYYRSPGRELVVFRVRPKWANGIYVVDNAASYAELNRRRKALERCSGDISLDPDADGPARARARTLVPISEYKGGYEQPLVLINRDLSFDEVEVVSGPS